jgi:hypothetical protein
MTRHQFDTTIRAAKAEPTPARQMDAAKGEATHGAHHDPLARLGPGTGGMPDPRAQAAALRQASGDRLARAGASLLQLQRQNGNRYVQQLVDAVQAKLVLGPPGDRYEREADRVAGQLVGRPASLGQGARQQEDDAELSVRTPDTRPAGGVLDPVLQQALAQARGGGQPLGGGIRRQMEQAFGADFSTVRMHVDTRADELNRLLGARAFTTGNDIFLRAGEYDPGSRGGQALIAHELTHVQQQAGAPIGAVPADNGQADREASDHAGTLPSAAGSVQRLMTADVFWRKTKLTARGGKSQETFAAIVKGLQDYENGNDEALPLVWDIVDQWLASPAAISSSRKKYVERLKTELQQEFRQQRGMLLTPGRQLGSPKKPPPGPGQVAGIFFHRGEILRDLDATAAC